MPGRRESKGSPNSREGSLAFSKQNTDMVSYEDLLIAQYLDELRKTKNSMKKKREVPASPYSQKLPHSDFGMSNRRPISATVPGRPGSGRPSSGARKPKIDSKFIADPNLWDPATPRSESTTSTSQLRKGRPASAPVRRKTNRPFSATSNLSWFYRNNARGWSARSTPYSACSDCVGYVDMTRSAFTGRRIKSQYLNKPYTIRCLAFKNGSRENMCRVAAPSMKVFLEMCTERLGLGFAARRVFLDNGKEVFDAYEIPPDSEVYISTGDNFKDPYKSVKQNIAITNGAKWTLSGVLLPEEGRKKKTKCRVSKRMRGLLESNRHRIVVYRNGYATEPMEIVADMSNKEEFLIACTAKLGLTTHAKVLYDWEGNEIKDLRDAPLLHEAVQEGNSPIYGPLWVSIGEAFSPTGTVHFIKYLKRTIKGQLKEAVKYKKEVNYALGDEKDKVTITDILSMPEDELYTTLELAEQEVENLTESLRDIEDKLQKIVELQQVEESEGSNYRMKHIKEWEFEHRLVGRKGLRLKVYENGSYENDQVFYFNLAGALRGTNDKGKVLTRLFDDLSTNHVTANPHNPKIAPVVKKIFDQYGKEITNVYDLEYDQEIWVSFGEPFINPFTYCIQAMFEKATAYLMEGETFIIREPLNMDLTKNRETYAAWEATVGYPAYDYEQANSPESQSHVQDLARMARIDARSTFLQAKNNEKIVLYPEVNCFKKVKKGGSTKLWPPEAQVWTIQKNGYIRCKSIPQLCLGVSDTRVDLTLGKDTVSGFVVNIQKKATGNTYQQWQFNPDATITCLAHPNLVLTYNGNHLGDEENQQPEGILPGQSVYLVVTERRQKKEASNQRFALKQERFDNLGQWKYNDATNMEWSKRALSWPVKEDGNLNEDYDWPMEGYLLPNAPPLHKPLSKLGISGMAPLRLMTMKNGERDTRLAMPVVGPNLTNMLKDLNKEKGGKSGKKPQHSKLVEKDVPVPETDNVEEDINLHCVDRTVRELEFIMFLDNCTSLLNLPFAARRLFDSKGNEHFSLVNLRRDDLVYVSCGEGWMDPKLSKDQQQRRILLSQLSQDIAKIRQYISLRNPEKYVLEMEGNLVANTRIIINRQWNLEEEQPLPRRPPPTERDSQNLQDSRATMFAEEEEENMTCHEIAHRRSEQRLNNLKWPWERLINVSQDEGSEDPDAYKFTDKEMYDKYKPQPIPKISRDTLQRFVYEDGYIACAANRTLVLGVLEQEGRVNPVLLVKRRPDDINQRWVIRENGEIRSKHSSQMVLTVAMPANEPFSEDEEGRPLTFSGCAVTLQARKLNIYGKAHQKWRYDAETGYIHAFFTNPYDKEITAANHADICTYAISHDSKIDQPGYLAEVPVHSNSDRVSVKNITVCTSCARAMRGRYKLQKLPERTEFSCAMGEAKKLKLQQIGSFRVLNGKVDLSTHEADLTLETWEDTLGKLREEANVKTIAKEINAAKTVKTIKILAYKNGEGRMHQGELICGSSIEGILNQCTHKLGLASAARKIFTEDGTLVLEIDDLIDWAVENYKSLMVDQLEKILHGKEESNVEDEEEEGETKPSQQSNGAPGGGETEQRGEGEGQDSTAEGAGGDNAEVDQQEQSKVQRERDQLLSQVQIPPVDIILRYPIEVWVSSGQEFFPPEKVETKMENRKKRRAFRSAVSLELDMEKHILRQMKGRRIESQNPGEYKPTRSSRQPVIVENNWQEPTVAEELKHDTIHKLETHLAEVKAVQKEKIRTVSVNTNRRLYQQPDMKRVMVFPNGESVERAVYVWGETLEEILDNATIKLGLWGQARIIYNMEGKKVEKFNEINKDELLCVSMGKSFSKPKNALDGIEIKANWGRARKQYGPSATDLVVTAPVNPTVNVDPFGPPGLALPPAEDNKSTTTNRPQSAKPPAT
ncbi:doublecortin domain-containing protein 1-like [Saccostrea echinata]|uniref:doublecortin domain-containing protein 1-like n=1 Tax=Saccostrea echinata TaxID=191078 RepID=UPI002A81B293|nr:doublecortin domain-containing protein 1-like [Saccostrea echinata]